MIIIYSLVHLPSYFFFFFNIFLQLQKKFTFWSIRFTSQNINFDQMLCNNWEPFDNKLFLFHPLCKIAIIFYSSKKKKTEENFCLLIFFLLFCLYLNLIKGAIKNSRSFFSIKLRRIPLNFMSFLCRPILCRCMNSSVVNR